MSRASSSSEPLYLATVGSTQEFGGHTADPCIHNPNYITSEQRVKRVGENHHKVLWDRSLTLPVKWGVPVSRRMFTRPQPVRPPRFHDKRSRGREQPAYQSAKDGRQQRSQNRRKLRQKPGRSQKPANVKHRNLQGAVVTKPDDLSGRPRRSTL